MSAISVKNVSKVFNINKEKRTTLKEKLLFKNTKCSEKYWALKGVTCEIKKGTTVGIIGRNGSGKSTLLKLMTRIMYPTTGFLDVSGKVSSLLELGAGFHPDFTGRENIYMNASILGFTKKEIDGKLNEIIAFSELEEFIDNPLRSYSSGMYMRLAFSVAISVDPDILLVDEILSVGDTAFQIKCIDRLKELKRLNKTIVIVSHDNNTLERLCDEIIWLHKGEVLKTGYSKEIINEYLDYIADEDGKKHNVIQIENLEKVNDDHVGIDNTRNRWGNGKVKIKSVEIFNELQKECYFFTSGDKAVVNVNYMIDEPVNDIIFGFRITTVDGINCYGTNTHIDNFDISFLPKTGAIKIVINELNLVEGKYLFDFAFHKLDGTAYDYYCGGYSIQIKSNIHDTGIVKLSHDWSVE